MSRINQNIDELLNAFIDGELTPAEQTEVQHLVAEDEQVAQRLRQLQECQALIQSLAVVEAPADMPRRIQTFLEEATPTAHQVMSHDKSAARKYRLPRVAAVTATVAVAAILTMVVHSILTSPDTSQPRMEMQPVLANETGTNFQGRLELKTGVPVAVGAFISSAIEENGLSEGLEIRNWRGTKAYSFHCSRAELNLLLADLAVIWEKCGSETLSVATGNFGERVVVDSVTVEQVSKIVNQDRQDKSVQLAKDFAVLNNMAALMPGKQILAAIDNRSIDFLTIPKPVLTGDRKKADRIVARSQHDEQEQRQVNLTIVVTGGK